MKFMTKSSEKNNTRQNNPKNNPKSPQNTRKTTKRHKMQSLLILQNRLLQNRPQNPTTSHFQC
ncbi:hypothetical protein [Helicobacter sp. T3_23-1056]